MPKYNSFTEYLQDNYCNQIKESLLEFVDENGVRNDEGVVIHFDKYEIASLNVYRVNFTKSEFSHVEFDFYIKVVFILDDGFDRVSDSYVGRMAGSFQNGFVKKDFVSRTTDEREGVFTNALVSVMRKEDYDYFATTFLRHFNPEALEKPLKFDIAKVAKNNGLSYCLVPLGDEILGKTYFADDVAEVMDEETGEVVSRKVHPGTVLINTNKVMERGEGVARNTFVHEAVHWFFHRNYFEFQRLLDDSQTKAVCYRNINDN